MNLRLYAILSQNFNIKFNGPLNRKDPIFCADFSVMHIKLTDFCEFNLNMDCRNRRVFRTNLMC